MLLGFGITCAHKAWMPVDRLAMLERLHEAGELPIRLHLLFDCNDERLGEVLERGPWANEWLSARGIKFFADGAHQLTTQLYVRGSGGPSRLQLDIVQTASGLHTANYDFVLNRLG